MTKGVRILFLIGFMAVSPMLLAQKVMLEGYVYASNNTGYLNEVVVTALDLGKAFAGKAQTNQDGLFRMDLDVGKTYELTARKPGFTDQTLQLEVTGNGEDKMYTKISMDRAPGYLLEVTLAEVVTEENIETGVDAITDATIEIYNKTKGEETLVLRNHPSHVFSHLFEQGSSYTVMVRKKGFFTKRMDVDVAVDGCILCMNGFGTVEPGVSDNLTYGNLAGTLSANLQLRRVELDEPIEINNIYYDLGKWDIRPDAAIELDKVVGVLKDNPSFIIEMSSHTDSRGSTSSNQELSQKRAESAVNYLAGQGIERVRLTAMGYGESKLKNKCGNGVQCSEEKHQINRRTELTVIGYLKEDPYETMSLKEIIEEEKLMEEIMALDATVIQIGADEEPPSNEEEPAEAEETIPLGIENENIQNSLIGDVGTVAIPVEIPEEEAKKLTMDSESLIEEEEIPEPPAWPKPVAESGNTTEVKSDEKVNSENEDPGNSSNIVLTEVQSKWEMPSIPEDYSGFKIQLLSSSSLLSSDHKLLKEFGDLTLEKSKNGSFHYLTGDFPNGPTAAEFREKIINNRFPNSKVVQYVEGERVE